MSFAQVADRDDAVASAGAAFRRDGVVVLDDLVDPATIARCLAAIERDDPGYDQPDTERNFGLYPGRFNVPLRIGHTLADRAILCPPPVLDMLMRLLGDAFLVDSFALLVSLPGAPDQARHPDALLFADSPADRLIPPFAAALAIPLVPMDETSGTTGFWPGSQLDPARQGNEFTPDVPVGSALLWDFRVQHRGLANRGSRPRPVLFTVFCREWWTEAVQHSATRYEKLAVAAAVRDGFDMRMQRLMHRARIVT